MKIGVGIFTDQGKHGPKYRAYTTWFNPIWEHCCEHLVEAKNDTEAKKIAIKEHKQKCEKPRGVDTMPWIVERKIL